MNPEFSDLIGLPYNFRKGPLVIEMDNLRELNCQGLVHIFCKRMGYGLPPEMRSKEIFEDEENFFRTIRQGPLKFGDVLIFGREEVDYRRLHLTVFGGDYDPYGSPLLLHATKIDDKVCVWPLSKFSDYPSYSRLYAVKRLISL